MTSLRPGESESCWTLTRLTTQLYDVMRQAGGAFVVASVCAAVTSVASAATVAVSAVRSTPG